MQRGLLDVAASLTEEQVMIGLRCVATTCVTQGQVLREIDMIWEDAMQIDGGGGVSGSLSPGRFDPPPPSFLKAGGTHTPNLKL
jgi:hypothetical protein